MRVLSGIQPTGQFHWGNYFGAIRQYIALQDNQQAFYFIADLHALTTIRDPNLLRELSVDAAIELPDVEGIGPDGASLLLLMPEDGGYTDKRISLKDGSWLPAVDTGDDAADEVTDPVTHLILALRKAMPLHATGPAVESVTDYGDWRRESGLLQPYRFVEREVRTGRTMNTLQWDRIISNSVITRAELTQPGTPQRQSLPVHRAGSAGVSSSSLVSLVARLTRPTRTPSPPYTVL